MTLAELVKKHSFNEVIQELIKLYPEQRKSKKGYIVAWDEISKLKPKKTKTNLIISIAKVKSVDDPPEDYWDVHGIKKRSKQSWALEYSPWSEWLTWEVDNKVLEELGEITCLGHILWEMTWNGFTSNEIAKEKKKLMSAYKAAKLISRWEIKNDKKSKATSNEKRKNKSR